IRSVTSKSAMTPSLSGRTATMLPGVRPIIRLASTPTATIWPVLVLSATTEGSLSTMPRPRTYTSVFAVPRSTAMSRPRKAIALLIRDKNLPAGSWQVSLQFSPRRAPARRPSHYMAATRSAKRREVKSLGLAPAAGTVPPGHARRLCDVQRTAAADGAITGRPFREHSPRSAGSRSHVTTAGTPGVRAVDPTGMPASGRPWHAAPPAAIFRPRYGLSSQPGDLRIYPG